LPDGDNCILVGDRLIENGSPTAVSPPLPLSIEKTEILFDKALPTYKYPPAGSMAKSVGSVPTGVRETSFNEPLLAIEKRETSFSF
jgi:hypothetical protein